MKKLSLGIALFLLPLPMLATAAIYEGPETEACFTQHSDPNQQENCLHQKRSESELQLEKVISDTDKGIKANNIGSFNGKADAAETSGEVYSKRFLMLKSCGSSTEKNYV